MANDLSSSPRSSASAHLRKTDGGLATKWMSNLRGRVRGIARKADTARDRRNWHEAVWLYGLAFQISPHRADLLIQRGHCLKELGRFAEAFDCYSRANKLAPSDDSYLQLGHLLKITGNLLAARGCYELAAALGSQYAVEECEGWRTLHPDAMSGFAANPTTPQAINVANGSRGPASPLIEAARALAWCEHDPADTHRMRAAVNRLFSAGYEELARPLVMMSHIRAGFAQTATGALASAARPGTATRSPHNPSEDPIRIQSWRIAKKSAAAALRAIAQLLLTDSSFPTPIARGEDFLLEHTATFATSRRDQEGAGLLGLGRGNGEGLQICGLLDDTFEEVAASIEELYAQLIAPAGPCRASSLEPVLSRMRARAAYGLPAVNFYENKDTYLGQVAARVLHNLLYDFEVANRNLVSGPYGSAWCFYQASRLESPLLLPYFGRGKPDPNNGATEDRSPPGLAGAIMQAAEEIAEPDLKPEEAASLERAVVLLAHGLDVEELHALFELLCERRLFGAAAAIMDEIVLVRRSWSVGSIIRLSTTLKINGSWHAALSLVRRASAAKPKDVSLLMELGILAKSSGEFDEAAAVFGRCLELNPDSEFLKQELLAILPEVDKVPAILARFHHDPQGRRLALERPLYRIYLDRPDDREGEEIWGLAPELSPELDARTEPVRILEEIEVLQIGRERRPSRWGDLPVLRGIEAIRVRAACRNRVSAMRVRVDGRTISRTPAIVAQPELAPASYIYVFNAWIDAAGVQPGLHELQLYFEEEAAGYSHRSFLIYIDEFVADKRQARSGSVVVLPAGETGPLDDRINALPSVVYPAARQLFDHAPQRVLVIRADQLGDFVLSIPAIKKLRTLLPGAEMTAVVSPVVRGIAEEIRLFERVIPIDFHHDPARKRRYLSLMDQIELQRQLRALNFDLAIDLCLGSESRPLLKLSGAPVTVGFKPQEFPWLSIAIDAITRDSANGKERVPHAALVMTLVDALGALLKHEPPVIPASDAPRELIEKFGIGETDRYALLHAGARLVMKRWPLARYLDLARLIIGDGMKVVLIVDDPADVKVALGAGLPPDRFSLISGRIPFAELDTLIAHCAAFVGNDSGPKHLAVLRGAKVVSIHMGQVNWQEWGQTGDGFIVTRHVPCYGCGILEAEECGKDLACLVHIRPSEVFAAVKRCETDPDRE